MDRGGSGKKAGAYTYTSAVHEPTIEHHGASPYSEVRDIEYHGTEDFLNGAVIVTISRLDDDQPGLETTIRRTVVTSSGKSCPIRNLAVGSQVTRPGACANAKSAVVSLEVADEAVPVGVGLEHETTHAQM